MEDSDQYKTQLSIQSIEEFLKNFGDPDDVYTKIAAEILLEILMEKK